MWKRDGACEKAKRQHAKVAKEALKENILKLWYWNTNGLSTLDKQLRIAEVMERESIDIMCLDEIHFRKGSNVSLAVFSDWTQYYMERGYVDKHGGGKMILVSNRVNHIMWEPQGGDAWKNNERGWVLVHNKGVRIAGCTVYMAAEVSTNTGNKDWNDQMYGHLTAEVQSLTRDGYKIMILGDMNGHIGNAYDGIPGNH